MHNEILKVSKKVNKQTNKQITIKPINELLKAELRKRLFLGSNLEDSCGIALTSFDVIMYGIMCSCYNVLTSWHCC